MKIAGVIIAGGRSSRMGREKAFALLSGRTILSHIVERIAPQVTIIAINANGDPDRFAETGLNVIPDVLGTGTPLAGLHAALRFARCEGFDAALTIPSDAPFLPRDLVRRLSSARASAAISQSGSQSHFLTGLWPHILLEKLEQTIGVQTVRVKDWTRYCNAATVAWPVEPFDPFFNVNTPQDLAEAERITAEFSP